MKDELDDALDYDTDQEVVIESDDGLDISMTEEDVDSLDENSALILAQKVSCQMERYEDIIITCEELGLNEEEAIKRGFNKEEYKRLKSLEKYIYSHIRMLKKPQKNNSFLGRIPTFGIILFVISFLFTVFPVNPYFPVIVLSNMNLRSTYPDLDMKFVLLFVYFAYVAIFILPQIIYFVILLVKGIKNKEKLKIFYSYLALFIINLFVTLPGVIIFLCNYNL